MVLATVLSIVVYLSPLFGGTIRANDLVFETPQLCETFVKELAAFSIKHEIVSPCAPRDVSR